MPVKMMVSLFTIISLFSIPTEVAASSVIEHYNENYGTADEEARIDLIISLEEVPSEKTRKIMEAIILDTKQADRVRMQAICSLGSSGNQESVPLVINILEDDLKKRRGFWACAIPLLGQLKDRRAISILKRIANLRDDHLAGMNHMAIEALAEMGDEREVALLLSKAYIVPVRFAVINGLARIASLQSVEILIEALQGEEEPEIVKAAEKGLLKIGKASILTLERTLSELPEGWDDIHRSRIKQLIYKLQQ